MLPLGMAQGLAWPVLGVEEMIPAGYAEHPCGLILPSALVPPPAPPAIIGIDLFAGCGGFSCGMEWGGIQVPVAVEWDVLAAATYVYNLGAKGGRFFLADDQAEAAFAKAEASERRRTGKHYPGACLGDPEFFGFNRPNLSAGNQNRMAGEGCRAMVIGDIRGIDGAFLLEAGGLKPGDVNVVFGGPPCQGFSRAGKQDPADARNNLVLEFLRIVMEVQPDFFVMENVPPLITQAKFLPLWETFQQQAHLAGYDLTADVIDACNYGVPQRRRRAIVMGSRGHGRVQFPLPTHWALTSPVGGARNNMLLSDGPSRAEEVDEEIEAQAAQGRLFE